MAEWWAGVEEEESALLPLFGQFMREGSLCFDIGGNVGRKTFIMRRLGAKVIFVEPMLAFGEEFVPEFYWRWGADKRVIAVPKAVAVKHEVRLSINQFMPEYSSISKAWMTESSHAPKAGPGVTYYNPPSLIHRTVPGVTLDALINVYGLPDFIKVDVEGAEDQAIGTLHTAVPALNMEYHADWIPIRALEHMDALSSYEWNYTLDNRPELILPEWLCRGKLLDRMKRNLTPTGPGSWGDIYGRLA